MILFWVICALMAVIALALILPPLLEQADDRHSSEDFDQSNIEVYRDQITELEADLRNGIVAPDQFQQERDELERRLLEDVSAAKAPTKKRSKPVPASRGLVYGLALGIPLAAVALYLVIGNKGALAGAPTTGRPMSGATGTTPPGDPNLSEQQRIEANVTALANRLQQNPNDAEGWAMLASSYTAMSKFSEASEAYAKATELKKDDPNLLADYAFALAMKNGRILAGEPAALLQRALTIDPENAKALQLSGSAAFQAKDYKKAIGYWEKLLKRAGPETELGQELSERIAEAKKLEAGG
ncbi:MAG TPA: c-type cytochrome biogenesis protein CcmI [Pyrinomonadaceae bacterium]